MLQVLTGARCRTMSPLIAQGLALLVLAASLVAMAPPAFGQVKPAVGFYRSSTSTYHLNGTYSPDGALDPLAEFSLVFGVPGLDVALLGDLAGAGTRYPILYRNGLWSVDSNKDATVDFTFTFGGAINDIPLIADMDGDGREDPVLFRGGTWYVSASRDGAVTAVYPPGQMSPDSPPLGQPGDVPLLGDVIGNGSKGLFVYRNGIWYGSTNRNGVLDKTYYFGGAHGDIPMMFDYDGDGKDDLVIFRNGAWYVSTKRDGVISAIFTYGAAGDKPLYVGAGAKASPSLDAARFLTHASFGPVPAEITKAATMGFSAYIDDQFALPATPLPVMAYQPQSQPSSCTSPLTIGGPADAINFGTNCPRDLYTQFVSQRNFFINALTAKDQLRQRVAWALSQILVVSAANDPIGYANRNYQQLLQNYAFDNFYNLLFWVSVDPLMGNYLDMVNNAKADPVRKTQPNENYAREVMQLFSIGLWELKGDGTLLLDDHGSPIPTYSQSDITQMAAIMTGWTYWPITGPASWNSPINYLFNMTPCEGNAPPAGGVACGTTNRHDITAKAVAFAQPYDGPVSFAANQTAVADLRSAVNALFYHPNTGPFIGKQLIQHLVTSNPSPAYVRRVANAFANNGSGVRGDMKAVVKAILLDPEALAPRNPITSTFGKLKEPVLLVTNLLRAMNAVSDGVYPLLQTPNMDQNVYTSPTVFNYYPADYVIPGTPLAGPQFGIFNATTYFPRANFVYNLTLGGTCQTAAPNVCGRNPDTTVRNSTGTLIDYGQLTQFAGNTTNLIQQVNDRLLFGTMPPGVKLAIRSAIDIAALGGPSGPYTAQQLLNRARTAVYLVGVSPKYQLEF